MMMLRPAVAKAGLPMQPPQQPSRASSAVQAPVLHQPAMQQAASRDPPPGTYRTKPCRHYEKGRCTWGASCRFLHATTRGAAAPPVTSVRIGTQPSVSSDSTSTVPAQVAPDTPVMPPTNPSTPAASAASPNGTHRYSHNPYSSSPMAGATSSPLASAKPTPLHFGAAFDEPAPTLAPLPMPMERRFSRP